MSKKIWIRPGFYLRLALIADLWAYLLVLIAFVLLPVFPPKTTGNIDDNVVTIEEIFFGFLGLIPIVLLFGRMFQRPRVPLNEWAYLATGAYGLFVLAAFLTFGQQEVIVRPEAVILVASVVSIGVIGAAGAHIFDGSTHPSGPIIERWARERRFK